VCGDATTTTYNVIFAFGEVKSALHCRATLLLGLRKLITHSMSAATRHAYQ
jgi:hypothetical protein